ncbi:hypothetical protein FHX80_112855 [Streptomyces brevispora]|uniref:Phage integrase family protein n=1 Tax=Streptomyces brevispora TaxID=887462 RepID=A0A561UYF9_9ACTN|nr:hypothetical protein [Streptomyces brevispora]TWG04408.1 hypothetical protein FHX80_112855 [Streptomyces brevispora]
MSDEVQAREQRKAGEDIVTVSHWLGHETPTITFDYYAHFIPQSGTKGAGAVNGLLSPPATAKLPRTLILPRRSPGLTWKTYPDQKPQLVGVRTTDGPSLPPRGSDRPGPPCSPHEEPPRQG